MSAPRAEGADARAVVDSLASVLRAQPEVPVAVVLEPDAVANLATKADDARCGSAGTRAAHAVPGPPARAKRTAVNEPSPVLHIETLPAAKPVVHPVPGRVQ